MPQPINHTIIENLRPLISAASGLTLSQVCSITELEPSTIQNWIKRGFVARPVNKKYFGRHIARIMLIAFLRDSMKLESIGELLKAVNGNADDESDDIIPEEKLLEYFCYIIERVNEAPLSFESIEETVKNAVCDYIPPKENAYKNLTDSLCIMTYAYVSSEFKQKAEQCFDLMCSNRR